MRNAGTRVIGPSEWRAATPPAREVFLAAYERLCEAARAAIGPSMFVAAVDTSGDVIAHTTLVDGQALTIGRHEQCALRVDSPATSLRHLVALVRLSAAREGGEPAHAITRLWDLATAHPFATE